MSKHGVKYGTSTTSTRSSATRRVRARRSMEKVRFPDDHGCFGCSPSNATGLGLSFCREGKGILA